MSLSDDIISQYVEVNAEEKEKKEETLLGKIVSYNGKQYVKLDGSDQLTPITSTSSVDADDRVTVLLKNHSAIVTGNLSYPSAKNSKMTEISDKVDEFGNILAYSITTENIDAINAYFENLTAITAKYENMEAVNAEIERLNATYANLDRVTAEDVEALNADIENLRSTFVNATNISAEDLNAANAEINNLKAYNANFTYVSADVLSAINGKITNLDATYANIDFANITEAAVEKIFSDSGIIKDIVVSEGRITGELVGVTIKGDIIEGGTVKADKLVILGEDGLYYKLNVDALGETTAASDPKYQNGLDGSVIVAKSITAEKVAVNDLVAFGATIGGFHITDSSIYSGVKTEPTNTTTGVYFDKDGQMAVGDATNFIKYSKDQNGVYKLEISADSILFGSSKKSVETELTEVKTTADGAKSTAETAQSTANTAKTTADTAKTTSNAAQSTANAAKSTADTAKSTADTAKSTADAAKTAANGAQEGVNSLATRVTNAETSIAQNSDEIALRAKKTELTEVKTTAETAQSTADAAKSAAETAQSTANGAQEGVNSLETRVTNAETSITQNSDEIELRAKKTELTEVKTTAETAQSTANTAKTTATAAQSTANTAKTTATAAQSTANTAKSTAETAKSTADTAKSTADAAKTTADTAKNTADGAQEGVNSLSTRVTTAETSIKQTSEAITLRATSEWVSEEINGTNSKISELEAQLDIQKQSITSFVRNAQGGSIVKQEADGVCYLDMSKLEDIITEKNTKAISDANENISKILGDTEYLKTKTEYISVGTDDNDKPYIELGEGDSKFKLKITNEKIEFNDGASTPAYITNQKLMINNSEVKNELRFGNFVWKSRDNGNMGLTWEEANG